MAVGFESVIHLINGNAVLEISFFWLLFFARKSGKCTAIQMFHQIKLKCDSKQVMVEGLAPGSKMIVLSYSCHFLIHKCELFGC
jgi:hypothetical protein